MTPDHDANCITLTSHFAEDSDINVMLPLSKRRRWCDVQLTSDLIVLVWETELTQRLTSGQCIECRSHSSHSLL